MRWSNNARIRCPCAWPHFPPTYGCGATVASMSRRREPQFDGSVANDRNKIAPPHRSSLRSRRHSNTSPNGSVLCVTAKLPGHVRVGSIATEIDFAVAYGRAANCHVFAKTNGWLSNTACEFAEVKRLAQRAVEWG